MLELAAVTSVVGSLTSIVGLSDKIFESWRKFRQSGEVETPPETPPDYYEKIEPAPGGGLAHSAGGDVKIITREELSTRLSPTDQRVVTALEKQMDVLVRQWSALTEQYELTIDPSQKAIFEVKLDDICVKLSRCLLQVTTLLQYLGFQLQDHYGAMRMIAETRQ